MAQLGFGDRAKKSAHCPFLEDSSASFSFVRLSAMAQGWNVGLEVPTPALRRR